MIKFFYTPKPNRFQYRPRFYNPDKEDFDKQIQRHQSLSNPEEAERRLEYYKKRINELEEKDRRKSFFNREKPSRHGFNPFKKADLPYSQPEQEEKRINFRRSRIYDEDKMFAKPISSSKILVYAIIAIVLFIWIAF